MSRLNKTTFLHGPFPFEARVQHEGRLKLALMNGGDEAAEVADTLRHDGLNGAAIVAFQSIEEERTMGERGARMEGLVSIRLTSVYKRTSCGDWQEGAWPFEWLENRTNEHTKGSLKIG